MSEKITFCSVEQAALELGLPVKWLRAEANAGRVPSVRAGRSIRLNTEAVAHAIDARARQQAPPASEQGARR